MNDMALLMLSLVSLAAAAAGVVSSDQGDAWEGEGGLPPQDDYAAPHGPHPGLTEAAETEIKQSFLDSRTRAWWPDASTDDVFVLDYYGTYDGCVVVRMTDRFTGHLAVITYEDIDGVRLVYSSSNKAIAWKDGHFYGLQDAYSQGLLQKGDIEEVAGRQKAAYPFLYES